MENQLSQVIATTSDEISDNVLVYKLFSNSTLLESLKLIENIEVFTTLKLFCTYEIKVCKLFLLIKI